MVMAGNPPAIAFLLRGELVPVVSLVLVVRQPNSEEWALVVVGRWSGSGFLVGVV
jgi:hypothetical protein